MWPNGETPCLDNCDLRYRQACSNKISIITIRADNMGKEFPKLAVFGAMIYMIKHYKI